MTTDRNDLFFASLFLGALVLVVHAIGDAVAVPWLVSSGHAETVQLTLRAIAGG